MSERKTEITVGISVVVALIILTLVLVWGKGKAVFSHRNILVLHFDNVQGLEESDPVMVRGLRKGGVDQITLYQDYVAVRLWIDKSVILNSDTEFTIERQDLMGSMVVSVYPGHGGKQLDWNKTYQGTVKDDMNELLARGNTIVESTHILLIELKKLIEKEEWSQIISNTREISSQALKIIEENREDLRLVIQGWESMTSSMETDSTIIRLGEVVTRLDSTLCSIQCITGHIEKESGTLGKLVRDRWLYDQLLSVTVSLDSLISDIKANPKKFVRISLF
jgi:phospholipid/cholesterol/gamma-HCH transport system substrate-binding protein